MVADHTSTPRRTAPTASTEDAPRTGRRRLARALTAVAASGALLVPAAGAAVAAPATDAPRRARRPPAWPPRSPPARRGPRPPPWTSGWPAWG